MEKYKKIKQIGEGAFGKVFKSKNLEDNCEVAIKRVPIDKENGIPFTAIREIKILKKFRHENLIKPYEVMYEEGFIFIVMEYLPFDLTALILNGFYFSPNHIRSLIYQLLKVTAYLHSHNLIHRDIKASNILISKDGVLKLADFGLTREHSKFMTNRVCTLWYRAPELLLGEMVYTNKVDSWSIGCIMLEMGLGYTPFKGTNEINQCKKIFESLGIPPEKYYWSDMFDLSEYKKEEQYHEIISNLYGNYFDDDDIVLIRELLRLSSRQRISSKNALKLKCMENLENIFFPIDVTESHEFYAKQSEKNV